MDDLREFGTLESKFITMKSGEVLEAVYEGHTIVPNHFNPSLKSVRYVLSGKFFSSTSKKLASMMAEIPLGTKVQIKRIGEQKNTKYEVRVA